MTAVSKTLPPDWDDVLHDIQQRLDQAVAAADARLATLAPVELAQGLQERGEEMARLQTSLQGLNAQLASAEQLVQEVDRTLQEAEAALLGQLRASGETRQKLAEWAGRAIG